MIIGLVFTVYEDVNWIHLAKVKDTWPPLVDNALNSRVPLKAVYFLTSCGTLSLSAWL